jgi:hypothetical protein
MVSGLGASPRQRESYTWFTAELANLHDGASRARYGGSPMQDLTAHQSFGHSDCERIVGGTLAQPVLALTSLGYVAAGVAVLCWAARVKAPLAGAAGVALVAVGAGSFAYHGPQPSWAERAHDLPMVALALVSPAGLAWSAPAAVVDLGDSGGGLRTRTGCLHRGTLGVAAMSAREPVAVPRRLARPLCRCRRMGRPGHGAGPASARQSTRIAAAVGRSACPQHCGSVGAGLV